MKPYQGVCFDFDYTLGDSTDSIVAGFEHQLDELYKMDAMNVDSDIRVMETMLRRDTATVEKDFGLGTAPAAPASPKVQDVDLGGVAAQRQEE